MNPDRPPHPRPLVPLSDSSAVPSSTRPADRSALPPVSWSIAGTDPSAGAGIQADLKTFAGLGVYGCTVMTAVIAQNTKGVQRVEPVPADMVEAQLSSIETDIPPDAIKLGMLARADTIRVVASTLARLGKPVVLDPVLGSSSGTSLLEFEGVRELRDILPLVTIMTPNRPELARLAGHPIQSTDDVVFAAGKLLHAGAKSILVKGGHATGPLSSDYWTDGHQALWLHAPRLADTDRHGGGCTLSSAIAAALAKGFAIPDALVIARAYVNQGLRLAPMIGHGRGPLFHGRWPADPIDMPWITDSVSTDLDRLAFPSPGPMALYPIVNRAEWVERLGALGVDMIQLRVKDLHGDALHRELKAGVAAARRCGVRLYINDHWREAITLQAYGVHIGQDDLATTDVKAIHRAGMRLGLSTHGYAEIARALQVLPSYLAIGTVFTSPSKSFAHQPLGLERFAELRRLVPAPVVAIGGITLDDATRVRAAGADGIAVISDVTTAPDLPARVAAWHAALPPVST